MENMPRTKTEGLFFSILMTFLMVYAMVCYNIALNLGGMSNQVFLMAFGELRIMWPAALILEMLVLSKPIMALTMRAVTPEMPPMIIILIRSAITVCLMCPSMSFFAAILFQDDGAQLPALWVQTAVFNFPMALCWQLCFDGPIGRAVFRLFFRRKSAAAPLAVRRNSTEIQ